MARFGLLASNNFVWNADTVLKDGAYKTQMTNSSQNLNPSYGYLWWLNGKSSFMLPSSQLVFNGPLMPNAPLDLYSAMGKNGQLINVVPSKKIVVIRIGDKPKNANELPMIFNNEIWKRLNNVMCNSTYSNIENNKNIHIYPNPSSDYILVDGVDMLENINVFNTLGQKQEVSFENNKIEIRSLTNGVYVLEITSENQLYRKAFIKN
jgi:CubicO group peptidase (beta-lactamase class C family)